MKVLVLAILFAASGAPFAEAYYNETVCGSPTSRTDVHYAKSTNPAQARAAALAKCQASGRGVCREPICQTVKQPSTVAELPPAVQRQVKARLAAIDRQYQASVMTAKQKREFDYAAAHMFDDIKRRQREEVLRKAADFLRECESMRGCPGKL